MEGGDLLVEGLRELITRRTPNAVATTKPARASSNGAEWGFGKQTEHPQETRSKTFKARYSVNGSQALFQMQDGRYRKRTFEFDFDGGNQTVQIDMESPEPEMNAPLQMVIPLDFNNRLEIKR